MERYQSCGSRHLHKQGTSNYRRPAEMDGVTLVASAVFRALTDGCGEGVRLR